MRNDSVVYTGWQSISGDELITSSVTQFSGSARILTARSYTNGTDARLTGSLIASVANNSTNFAGTGVHVIGNSYSSWASVYEFGEILHYNRGLTDAEMATVETYLQNKWNITVATQSVDPVLGSDNSYTP